MAIKNPSFFFIVSLLTLFSLFTPSLSAAFDVTRSNWANVWGGYWVLLQPSIGISAMHMQVLHNNKIIFFDRTDSGPSNISLPANKCRLNDEILKPDCTSHSVLYDIASNTFRPLMVLTDTWCSSGAVDRDGTLVQTGGYHNGERVIRLFSPSDDETSDWVELKKSLWDRRWYASNQILPDNRIIIVGGRKVFTYEFYPKNESLPSSYYLPFLIETRDPEENNLYPFLHLLPDGNLFIFANRRSILFDYVNNKVVKEFPVIPGNDKRSYPSTGSSVLLPLRLTLTGPYAYNLTSGFPEAEVMVCGGAPPGAFLKSQKERVFVEASTTCGRLKVTDPEPVWSMEVMPMPRVMTDMILLPTGEVILINGATNGTAGWENGANPNLNPVLYLPNQEPPLRFLVLNPSKIPRMYHSSAVLVPDGRILVGGSNPHARYNFTAYPYPTELSLEAFYPHYLSPLFESIRPSILTVESTENRVSYNEVFSVTFSLAMFHPTAELFVSLLYPSFATHSWSMNQRMVVLKVLEVVPLSILTYKVVVIGPNAATVAPPGYYMIFVVHSGIPSPGVWIKVM
ncbi:aldehyde oxidase GLOX [Pistacia vera]|uniref:aldehyde oxidase GLOX n=1 Tax=Pistacia vera TaxID=55513 RepID=UPI0012631C52|nr:aldehyde oxidase GLOX [Pistacia vera]